MAVILALDVGERRIGVASADDASPIAFPYTVVEKKKHQELLEIIKKKSPILIVVGLPLGADGSENAQCEKVRNFCRRLSKRMSIPIEFFDEHLSSDDAKHRLMEGGSSSSEIDSAAAAVILQSFLDARALQKRG